MRSLIYRKPFCPLGSRLCLGLLLIPLFSFAAKAQICKNAEENRVLFAETLLSRMGYWITKPDCTKDSSTFHATMAFQKVEGVKRTGILTDELIDLMVKASRPPARYPGGGHIEVDINRQVLFVVNDDGIVARILPVSTGNEKPYVDDGKTQIAHTPRGHFSIYRKISGVRRTPLGNLYNPNYFFRGVAIHGSNSIPSYPASHGCVRIPRFADPEFAKMVWVGMSVYVFD